MDEIDKTLCAYSTKIDECTKISLENPDAARKIIEDALSSTDCSICKAILEDIKSAVGTERLTKSAEFAKEIFCPTHPKNE